MLTSTACFNSRTPGGVRRRSRLTRSRSIRFNSRTPGGVRQKNNNNKVTGASFNSRTPGGVRLQADEIIYLRTLVSIHAPREGCDGSCRAWLQGLICFNSRTPGGVRHIQRQDNGSRGWFQFTHPGRGATKTFRVTLPRRVVSIHAPREGCDSAVWLRVSSSRVFQFTHPGRGATRSASRVASSSSSFNSRTPGGVRLDDLLGGADLVVSIHAPREGCD